MNFMKKIVVTLLAVTMLVCFVGCEKDTEKSSSNATTTTAYSIKNNEYYNEIDSCIKDTVKAFQTNTLEDRLKIYPDYFVQGEYGGEAELEKAIKDFYSCDTEYEINKIEDVSTKYAEKCSKEVKSYYDIDVNIDKVVYANVSYKYTNYSDNRLDDSQLIPTDEYYICIDGNWYYGWGLEINSELSEEVIE